MASLRKSRPKLKDSCDNCATAKVRCGKEKPACQRCNEKGHACVYSYSCRAGRHLVKGDRAAAALGTTAAPSTATPPLFNFALPMDSSTVPTDTPSPFGSQTHSRNDSLTDIYSCPTFYSGSSENPTYQPVSYSISPPEPSMGLPDLSTNYLSHTRSNSQSIISSAGSVCERPASTMPCVPDPLAADAVQEPQWNLSDIACLNLESSSCVGHCMMIGNQTCLARLLSTFGLQPGEFSPVTDFSLSEPTSIIAASAILNQALKGDNDPIAVNKVILDLATSTFACSCSSNDAKLQHLLVAIALNVMARYSTVAFGDDVYSTAVIDHASTPSRSQFVLDELHRVANFLDTLDRRLQSLQHQAKFRHASADSQGSVAAGIENVYAMGAMSTASAAAYPCSSASSCSSGIASPDPTLDPGFAFSAVELRRRLQGLRADIVSSMRSG